MVVISPRLLDLAACERGTVKPREEQESVYGVSVASLISAREERRFLEEASAGSGKAPYVLWKELTK